MKFELNPIYWQNFAFLKLFGPCALAGVTFKASTLKRCCYTSFSDSLANWESWADLIDWSVLNGPQATMAVMHKTSMLKPIKIRVHDDLWLSHKHEFDKNLNIMQEASLLKKF